MGRHSKRREIPVFEHPIIETHCHLDYLQGGELEQVIKDAMGIGVERIVTIAVSPGNLDTVLGISRGHPAIWCTQGIHPHEADQWNGEVAALIRSRMVEPEVLALGEIGLDYYYDHADRKVQRQVFEAQLQIAADCGMPVVIHTREADEDTRDILANFSGKLHRKGVIHSFTSGLGLAEYCLAEGFYLGFNGITTFKRADNVRAVVEATPLSRILLETDAPYLTPVPYRGKPNAPCYLPFIAETVARVKCCDVEALLAEVYRNSLALFFAGSDARCAP